MKRPPLSLLPGRQRGGTCAKQQCEGRSQGVRVLHRQGGCKSCPDYRRRAVQAGCPVCSRFVGQGGCQCFPPGLFLGLPLPAIRPALLGITVSTFGCTNALRRGNGVTDRRNRVNSGRHEVHARALPTDPSELGTIGGNIVLGASALRLGDIGPAGDGTQAIRSTQNL